MMQKEKSVSSPALISACLRTSCLSSWLLSFSLKMMGVFLTWASAVVHFCVCPLPLLYCCVLDPLLKALQHQLKIFFVCFHFFSRLWQFAKLAENLRCSWLFSAPLTINVLQYHSPLILLVCSAAWPTSTVVGPASQPASQLALTV